MNKILYIIGILLLIIVIIIVYNNKTFKTFKDQCYNEKQKCYNDLKSIKNTLTDEINQRQKNLDDLTEKLINCGGDVEKIKQELEKNKKVLIDQISQYEKLLNYIDKKLNIDIQLYNEILEYIVSDENNQQKNEMYMEKVIGEKYNNTNFNEYVGQFMFNLSKKSSVNESQVTLVKLLYRKSLNNPTFFKIIKDDNNGYINKISIDDFFQQSLKNMFADDYNKLLLRAPRPSNIDDFINRNNSIAQKILNSNMSELSVEEFNIVVTVSKSI